MLHMFSPFSGRPLGDLPSSATMGLTAFGNVFFEMVPNDKHASTALVNSYLCNNPVKETAFQILPVGISSDSLTRLTTNERLHRCASSVHHIPVWSHELKCCVEHMNAAICNSCVVCTMLQALASSIAAAAAASTAAAAAAAKAASVGAARLLTAQTQISALKLECLPGFQVGFSGCIGCCI